MNPSWSSPRGGDLAAWDALLGGWAGPEAIVGLTCPSEACHTSLRVYFHGAALERGGLWVWCPSCRLYQHYSARVPAWWEWERARPPLTALCHCPDLLDAWWTESRW